jgi:hypothetical protein
MLWLLCSLLSTAVLLFLGFSLSGYRATYPASDSFRAGTTQLVEITLVRQDERNLACASDVVTDGLRCGFNSAERAIPRLDERHTLRPYSSVKGELLLAAGLWSSLPGNSELPNARFTVVCNFHVTSVLKSASLRWAPKAKFERLERSVSLGSVSDCVIPP